MSMGIDMIGMHVVNKSKNGSGHVVALLYLNIVPPKTDMEPQDLRFHYSPFEAGNSPGLGLSMAWLC